FGRVSRAGAMALSWSMDKIGPMCRSVEDCALVLHAIHGPDGRDPTASAIPFNWDGNSGTRGLRIGYIGSAFEPSDPATVARHNADALNALRRIAPAAFAVETPAN